MSVLKRYNRTRFSFNTDGLEYKSLGELYKADGTGVVYTLRAMWITTGGNFGSQPVFATEQGLINCPSHLTAQCNDILASEEACNAIEAGEAQFTIHEYESHGKKCYSVTFL